MQCDNGEIEVFLCPEDESSALLGGGATSSSDEASTTDTESEASPSKKPLLSSGPPPSPPPRLDLDEESRSSDIGQIRNVLISASEDFGPMGNQRLQLQTLDQEQSKLVRHISKKCLTKTLLPRLLTRFRVSVLLL